MKWFSGITNLEDLHKHYIKLARKYHPDVGGDESVMKEINAERDELQQSLKSHSRQSYSKQYYSRQSRPKQNHSRQSYSRQNYSTQINDLEELLKIAKIRNYKMGWVAINALKFAKSYEDCLNIARACGYKDGWAWYKWKEFNSH